MSVVLFPKHLGALVIWLSTHVPHLFAQVCLTPLFDRGLWRGVAFRAAIFIDFKMASQDLWNLSSPPGGWVKTKMFAYNHVKATKTHSYTTSKVKFIIQHRNKHKLHECPLVESSLVCWKTEPRCFPFAGGWGSMEVLLRSDMLVIPTQGQFLG